TKVNPSPSTIVVGPAADMMHDRLFLAAIDPVTHEPTPVTGPVLLAQTLPLVEVTWDAVDALKVPICLTARLADGTTIHRVSVARGNIALADPGRSVEASYDFAPPLSGEPTFRLRLQQGPLTMQSQPGDDPTIFPPIVERPDLAVDVRQARPAVA